MDLYAIIEEYLRAGKGGTMATIVKKLGAAPREEGAKMFVGSDGKFFGTIGGGCVEAEVWQEAMRVGKSGQAKLLHYRMDGRLVEDEGMICGGNIDIFLEPVTEGQRAVYDAIRRLEREGKSGLIVTRFGDAGFLKGLVHQDGTTEGDSVDPSIPENFEGYLAQKRPAVEGGTVVEPVLFPSMLYIFGAGHVSQFVSRIAAMCDFDVTVVDDRADFANRERFPEASGVMAEDFMEACAGLSWTGREYVVILTRGHKHDAVVLEEVLRRPLHYVGMIGSRRKNRMVMDYLKGKGFEEDLLKTVHAPIGIDIGSETPAEIGVSIVAQLIKARRERA
jgi:xanthine dehydrogenase accessory factor